ncbi:hypothetical protein SS50377_24527 [Spironucleus salmonicida]|uniref:Uncharacterized protein n=1 Tax=Spironucleus salmonicida TaxID=348837 RepID=V6LMS2_9EUKA|nr:hypothetical protein SS50377_24527 [Spironucleus salmonicida]|eukprot:EST45930.1 Hypothetical protein SS50377_13909 [Spironucleus salmonicida]
MQPTIISLIGRQCLPVQSIPEIIQQDFITSIKLRRQSIKSLVSDGNVQAIRNLIFTPYQFDQFYSQILTKNKYISTAPTHRTSSNEVAQLLLNPNSSFFEIKNLDKAVDSLIYYLALTSSHFTPLVNQFEQTVQSKLDTSQLQSIVLQEVSNEVQQQIRTTESKLNQQNEKIAQIQHEIIQLKQISERIDIGKTLALEQFQKIQTAQEQINCSSKSILTKVQYQFSKKQTKVQELQKLLKVIQNYITNDLTQKEIDYEQMKTNFTSEIQVYKKKIIQLQDQESSIKLRQQTLTVQKQEISKKQLKQDSKLNKFESEITSKIDTYTTDVERQLVEFQSNFQTLKLTLETSKRCQRDTDALMARNQKLEEEIIAIKKENAKLREK